MVESFDTRLLEQSCINHVFKMNGGDRKVTVIEKLSEIERAGSQHWDFFQVALILWHKYEGYGATQEIIIEAVDYITDIVSNDLNLSSYECQLDLLLRQILRVNLPTDSKYWTRLTSLK